MLTLRQARMARLLTVRELAERAGVAMSTVHLTETGKTTPRVSIMRRLAEALDMPATEIAEFASAMGLPMAHQADEAGMDQPLGSGDPDAEGYGVDVKYPGGQGFHRNQEGGNPEPSRHNQEGD